MSQPRFDELRERLLRSGIAPRHVRRYVCELRDHFDDLVREELSQGASSDAAEVLARSRLGNEHDLAEEMLARPGLRSVTSRYPWVVFGLGPIAMLIAGLAATVLIEVQVFSLAKIVMPNPTHHLPPEWAMQMISAWNQVPTLVAPLGIAALLCFVGARQRVSVNWVVTGVITACVLGGFHKLSFTDNGYHGELMLSSGLLWPFHRDLIVAGIWRAAADLAVVGGIWWFVTRRNSSFAMSSEASA
jgi:hypothetical protein